MLALAGFAAGLTLATRFRFPGPAARVRGSALVYAGATTAGMVLAGRRGTARLELGEDGVTIRSHGPFRPAVRWEARYLEISQVQTVQVRGTSGLLLRGPGRPVAFWTPRWAEIADLLELRAVPVSRDVTKTSPKDFS
ncbi:MAG TPA: hypothetical protein VGS19_35515 [Streptosporangiaceae bacterium]|nr:hypothetical protein [Streptosporangiaceae bacterium]